MALFGCSSCIVFGMECLELMAFVFAVIGIICSVALYFGMELFDGGLPLFDSCCSQNVVARVLSVEAFIVLPLDA